MKVEKSKPVLSKYVEGNFDKEGEEYNERLMGEHGEIYKEVKKSDMENMKKELEEIFGEEIATKICDVLPVNKATITAIVMHFSEEVDEGKIDKGFEIVKKYLKLK